MNNIWIVNNQVITRAVNSIFSAVNNNKNKMSRWLLLRMVTGNKMLFSAGEGRIVAIPPEIAVVLLKISA